MKILDFLNNISPQKAKIYKPYLIAEAGVNHEANMDLAKRLIDEAKEGGADAIKFQTYKADTIASKNSPYYWDISKEPTRSQHELFKKYDKFWKDEFELLKKYCDQADIEFLSTPFDIESATFLNELMPVFKISSSDLSNRPFIEYMCQFQKPIILSTGASFLHEIQESVSWIAPYKNPLVLMHCVLNYPTEDQNANLGMILGLKDKFPEYIIGYSDHTLPKDMRSLEIATLLGAAVLEKHFTHDKTLQGNDHYHAMDKEDIKVFRQNIERTFQLVGENFAVTALDSEEAARQNARRSIVLKQDLPKGTLLTEQMLTFKRPAHGISPKFWYEVIGKTLAQDLPEDTVLQWKHLE